MTKGRNNAPGSVLWMWPLAALLAPPFLLVPLVYRLPGAQLFKDFYEACLWLSPAVGVAVLVAIWRRKRADPASLRRPGTIVAGVLAGLDLLSPLMFYVLLAILAGH